MKKHLMTLAGAATLVALLAAGALTACDSSSGVHENPPVADSGPGTDTGGGGTDTGALPDGSPPPLDCFPNPTTHDEIINACTDAAKFDKKPNLPLLLADGGLPPLP